jgi:hypothetical protein
VTKSRFQEAAPATTTTGRNRCQIAFHLPDVHGGLETAVGTVVGVERGAAPHER